MYCILTPKCSVLDSGHPHVDQRSWGVIGRCSERRHFERKDTGKWWIHWTITPLKVILEFVVTQCESRLAITLTHTLILIQLETLCTYMCKDTVSHTMGNGKNLLYGIRYVQLTYSSNETELILHPHHSIVNIKKGAWLGISKMRFPVMVNPICRPAIMKIT